LQVLQIVYSWCSGGSIVTLHRRNEAIADAASSAHTINPHVHTIGELNKGDIDNKIITLQKKIEYIINNK
jgi:hypothetical protein